MKGKRKEDMKKSSRGESRGLKGSINERRDKETRRAGNQSIYHRDVQQ